jgi:predicted acetyltransferase
VLITCDDDNIASIKVIEHNGGVLEDRVTNRLERGIVTTRRYWIEIER